MPVAISLTPASRVGEIKSRHVQYRATLRSTGETVAVKVQRPQVLETVSLNLYLARKLGMFVRNFPALSDHLNAVALLDEFACRFYQELDTTLSATTGRG